MKTPWIEAGLQAGQHFLDHFVQNIQNPPQAPVYGDVQKYNQSFQEHLSPGDETNAATLPVPGKQYHDIGPNGEVGPVSDTPYPYNPPQQRPQPYQDQTVQVQQPNPAFNALGGQTVANAAGQAMSQIGEGVGHIIHGFSNPNLQGSQEAAQGFQGMVGGAEGALMSPLTGSLEALPEEIKNPIKQGTDAGMTLVAKSFLKYLMPQASEQALNNPDVINPMKLALQTTLMAAAAHDQGFRDRATDQINQPQDNKVSLDKLREDLQGIDPKKVEQFMKNPNESSGANKTSNQLSPKQMANQLGVKKVMGVNEGSYGAPVSNDIQTNPDQIPQPEDTGRMTYLKRNKELPAEGEWNPNAAYASKDEWTRIDAKVADKAAFEKEYMKAYPDSTFMDVDAAYNKANSYVQPGWDKKYMQDPQVELKEPEIFTKAVFKQKGGDYNQAKYSEAIGARVAAESPNDVVRPSVIFGYAQKTGTNLKTLLSSPSTVSITEFLQKASNDYLSHPSSKWYK